MILEKIIEEKKWLIEKQKKEGIDLE